MPERVAHPDLLDASVVEPEEFQKAARSFPLKTAQTYDGFHVKHWGQLQGKGTKTAARLANLCLALGTMPRQLDTTVGKILPKPKGGFRSTGVLPALYRVVMKQQLPQLRQWEAGYDHPAFSFQSGRNALHQVWVQAAEAEHAVNSPPTRVAGVVPGQRCDGRRRTRRRKTGRLHYAMVLWDMSEYYESVGRERLRQQHVQTGFPAPWRTSR